MSLTATAVADYLARYAAAFQEEYRRLTAPPPDGGGYPPLQVSPYLGPGAVDVIVSPDGVASYCLQPEPAHQWWLAGGPALMVDYPGSRTPRWVLDTLKASDLAGKDIGIYRLVSQETLPDDVWSGILGPILEEAVSEAGTCEFRVTRTELHRIEVLQRLTFGAFGSILNLHLPGFETHFWKHHIVRRLGFVTADRAHRRFIDYLELSPHVEAVAWDERAIPTRVEGDLRRDFSWAFAAASSQAGGFITMGKGNSWVEPFFDRLSILDATLAEFADLLQSYPDADERMFHAFIEANPILLDVYAEPISKPRWFYPSGISPLGKAYVEPDFILKYPDASYRLVELERPAKDLATVRGEPRAGVNQAAFQIGEWRAYIANHYDLLKAEYPGISVRQSATIVIGRSSPASVGQGRTLQQYKELLASQYQTVDILTYDELLDRARQAYARITALAVGRP